MDLLKRVFERAWGRDNRRGSESPSVTVPGLLDVYEDSSRKAYFGKESWDGDQSGPPDPNSSDALYRHIVDSLDHTTGKELLEMTRRLRDMEQEAARAACLQAYVLLLNGRLDEAEETLKSWMRLHGEDAIFLVHLARIYADRGDQTRAELTLWRALKRDPNEIHAVEWFTSIHRDRFGQHEYLRALEQLTSFPGSWRPQLWLAQAMLEERQFDKARRYYQQALSVLEEVPSDVMRTTSEALGNAGRISDIVELLCPRYKAEEHGLIGGNNLLRACLALKDTEKALAILRDLNALKRPDWREQLQYWAERIDQALSSQKSPKGVKTSPVSLLTLENPVWSHRLIDSDLLLPQKGVKAIRIAFLSCSCKTPSAAHSTDPEAARKWARLIPLFLAEQIHMLTTAESLTLIMIKTGGSDFYSPEEALKKEAIRKMGCKVEANYVLSGHLDATQTPWEVRFDLESLGESESQHSLVGTIQPANPGADLLELSRRLQRLVLEETGVHRSLRPIDYRLPLGDCFNLYLDGLCESLTLSAAIRNCSPAMLYDERSLLDRLLNLALEDTGSDVTRIMFVGALAKSKASGSEVFKQYESQVERLLLDHPLTGFARESAEKTLAALYA
ncbi:MAG: tetratricopeptide repeat protein [Acidobacteriota bacterium]